MAMSESESGTEAEGMKIVSNAIKIAEEEMTSREYSESTCRDNEDLEVGIEDKERRDVVNMNVKGAIEESFNTPPNIRPGLPQKRESPTNIIYEDRSEGISEICLSEPMSESENISESESEYGSNINPSHAYPHINDIMNCMNSHRRPEHICLSPSCLPPPQSHLPPPPICTQCKLSLHEHHSTLDIREFCKHTLHRLGGDVKHNLATLALIKQHMDIYKQRVDELVLEKELSCVDLFISMNHEIEDLKSSMGGMLTRVLALIRAGITPIYNLKPDLDIIGEKFRVLGGLFQGNSMRLEEVLHMYMKCLGRLGDKSLGDLLLPGTMDTYMQEADLRLDTVTSTLREVDTIITENVTRFRAVINALKHKVTHTSHNTHILLRPNPAFQQQYSLIRRPLRANLWKDVTKSKQSLRHVINFFISNMKPRSLYWIE